MGQRFRDAFHRFVDIDYTGAKPFLLLSLAFFAVRLPFIDYGHGTDPDAWRVALTAQYLLDTGDYFPSRLPGNPLHELTMTLFIPGGWIATNLATALVSLGGVYVFAWLVRYFELPNPGLLVVGFAFAPLLIINSIATMDYMWTLTALLAAYYSLLKGRPVLSGVLLGIAIGFRLQAAVLWLPLIYLLWREQRRDEIPPFTLAVAGVGLVAFSPVLVVYGTQFLNYYDASVWYGDVIQLLGKEALGIIGALGVLAAIALSLPRLRSLPGDAIRNANVGVWIAAIALVFASFSRLPHEVAYLIPVFPFALLLLGRYLTRAALATAIGAILLAGVADVTTPDDTLQGATIGRGLVLSNAETMQGQEEFVEQIMANELPDHSVALGGFIYPQLAVRQMDNLETRILRRDYEGISMLTDRGESVDVERDIRYVWLLTYETFDTLRAQGYDFYLVPDAGGGTAALYDYRPTLFGATLLTLDQEESSVAEGQAETDR